MKDGVGIWTVIVTKEKTPGKRYGHTLAFSRPYLIVFGGNIGSKAINDCWVLNVEAKKSPVAWMEIKLDQAIPPARVYHSASVCLSGIARGMMVIFGGRNIDDKPLGDTWGLGVHRDGSWYWVKAPEAGQKAARYQHSSLFVGSTMFISGGRTNNVMDRLPL